MDTIDEDGETKLQDKFPGYYRRTKEELDRIWRDGIIVLDTNVLLNLYRYSERAREELLGVLRRVKDQLWIPYQVAEEFHRDRSVVIKNQKQAYSAVQQALKNARNDVRDKMGKMHRDSGIEANDLLKKVEETFEVLIAESKRFEDKAAIQSIKESNSPDDDEVWRAMIEILDGRVGERLPPERQRGIVDEQGPRRYEAEMPPGYKDLNKKGDRRYGDLVLWFEVIEKARETGKSILFVTDDTKEDWWQTLEKPPRHPRPELVNEMHREAGVLFHILLLPEFLQEASNKLDRDISQDVAEEIEDLRPLEIGSPPSPFPYLNVIPVVTKTASPNPANVGSPLTFHITLTNEGNTTAPDVTISDVILPSMDLVSVTATSAGGSDVSKSCFRDDPTPTTPNGAVGCRVGDIPGGESATMDIVVIPRQPGTYRNHAGSSFALPPGISSVSNRNLTNVDVTVL